VVVPGLYARADAEGDTMLPQEPDAPESAVRTPATHGGAISVSGLRKAFDAVIAVDSIDFEVRPGEFFSLLGPSGCGKTTTLRMLAGFEEPTDGSILLDGAEVTYVPAHKRPVNTVRCRTGSR
jgi:spermidine/putrescine transport system ATP-binding protein